jgi:hypothetical protein
MPYATQGRPLTSTVAPPAVPAQLASVPPTSDVDDDNDGSEEMASQTGLDEAQGVDVSEDSVADE